MAEPVITLTESQLKELIHDTVNETLTKLGVEVEHPINMQADFRAIREWREASTLIRKKGLATFIGILVTGLCAMLWLGLKDYLP